VNLKPRGLEAIHSTTALIHGLLDNARYHHAKIVQEWPARLEILSALMREPLTHDRTYPHMSRIRDAIFDFLRHEVPNRWGEFCDLGTDNSRVILPAKFRVSA